MTRRATNMFVCSIRFIRLGHAYRCKVTPEVRGARGGSTTTGAGLPPRPPARWSRTQASAKGKATLCKQIAGASVPLRYKARVSHIIVCCRRDPT